MPGSGPRPGRWSTDFVPYLRDPLRAFADWRTEVVVLMVAAQSSKTEGLLCAAGWHMDSTPRDTLIFEPTEKLARSLARTRLHPMIEGSGSLLEKSDPIYNRPGSLERFIAGRRLGIGWMGSKVETASHPAAMVLVDEVDLAVELAADHDPIGRAKARTKAFPGAKVGAFSTPTDEATSPIYKLWKSGTRMRWCWTCPGCGHQFAPEIQHARYPEKAEYHVIRAEAWIECPECEHHITDADRDTIHAEYVPYVEDQDGNLVPAPGVEPINSVASFWVTGFCSPLTGIGQIMEEYARAAREKTIQEVRSVVTEWCGEPWREAGERAREDDVRDCQRVDAPAGPCQLVTAFIDVQQDSLYYAVRGWWPGTTSMLATWGRQIGASEYDDVWMATTRVLDGEFFGRKIDLCLVDSGYQTAQVLEWCRRNVRWSPSKGQERLEKPFRDYLVDEGSTGRQLKRLRRWDFNTDTWKTWLYNHIRQPDKDGPGAWLVPEGIEAEYCSQVVNEERRISRGKVVWSTTGSGQNHLMDCEVGCAVAAHIMDVRRLRPITQSDPAPERPPPQRRSQGFQRRTF